MNRGKIFYELSEIAGECSSGAPIFINKAPIWDVFAIYVGDAHGRKGGYGLSLESIGEWVPEMLGCTIAEEAKRPVSEL